MCIMWKALINLILLKLRYVLYDAYISSGASYRQGRA